MLVLVSWSDGRYAFEAGEEGDAVRTFALCFVAGVCVSVPVACVREGGAAMAVFDGCC